MQSSDESQITERNRKIRLIMQVFSCSYATAAQFYSAIRNFQKESTKC